ncbi:MAG: hypothetical protein J5552_06975 [Prevotella sp.]|nr:hypothetical protein [Prevotella sp.]
MNKEQIEKLLERYLDGETTNEEENLLRHYFTTTQIVPPEWEAYKALFCWEVSQQQPANSNSAMAASTPKRQKSHLLIAASIAVLLLIGAGIVATLLHPSHARQQTIQNYAVLDGRFTTDATVIAREVEEALLLVSASDEDTFDAIENLEIP